MAGSLSFFAPTFRFPGLNQPELPPRKPIDTWWSGAQSDVPVAKIVTAEAQNTWGIVNAVSGAVPFDIDSMVSLDYDHANKVSNFPVERGSFASYNKVNEPRVIKLKMAVHGASRVTTFLAALESELTSTDLFTIISPEMNYASMTLEKVAYPRTAEKSVDQVTVNCSFIQVIQVQSQSVNATIIPQAKIAKSVPPPPLAPCHTSTPEAPVPAPIDPFAGHSF